MKDEYLGDGVYASFDGYMIWLDLRAQDSTTRIAMEPPVAVNLLQYMDRAWPGFIEANTSQWKNDEAAYEAKAQQDELDGADIWNAAEGG